MQTIVLAYDVGPGVGLGHRARLQALGAELRDLGYRAELVPTGNVVRADAVVVDSYRFRADDRTMFRARWVGAVDDLDRDLDVDLLVTPRPGAEPTRATATRTHLAGAEYVLIDPRATAVAPRPVQPTVRTVLVTCGAADQDQVSHRLTDELRAQVPAETTIRWVRGPFSPLLPTPPGVELVDGPDSLLEEVGSADLVITAGGVTLLEALALGRPSVTVVLHENQRAAAHACADAGATILAEVGRAATVAAALLADAGQRRTLSERARQLVDGRGAWRVARTILAAVAGTHGRIPTPGGA